MQNRRDFTEVSEIFPEFAIKIVISSSNFKLKLKKYESSSSWSDWISRLSNDQSS